MVVERGQVWWADLAEPAGSAPGFRRPVVIVQSDAFNRSRLRTIVAVVLTSNLRLVDAPGNVLIPARSSGLPKTRLPTCRRSSRSIRTLSPSPPDVFVVSC